MVALVTERYRYTICHYAGCNGANHRSEFIKLSRLLKNLARLTIESDKHLRYGLIYLENLSGVLLHHSLILDEARNVCKGQTR
jgi:hypothetical protein